MVQGLVPWFPESPLSSSAAMDQLLGTELGRAEREEMWVALTDILQAFEIYQFRKKYSLCHLKGHKTPHRGK